jgi:hypothetical protein
MGVSLVLHPENPYCPTAHMNVRALIATRPDAEPAWWFGGGMDLTPYYPFAEDIRHFHATCKQALQPFGDDTHARYKKWCDEYFFLKHRNEPRGVGGVFFDDLNEGGFERCFALTRAVGDAFPTPTCRLVESALDTLWRTRTRLPGLPARSLRRVQSGLGSWHSVRPAIGRANRIDPDVAAPGRQVALRLATRSRHCGSCALRNADAARLGIARQAGCSAAAR